MRIEVFNRTKVRILRKDLVAKTGKIFSLLRALGYWKKPHYTLNLVFVPDRESRIIHQRFMKKPAAANVLSFDYGAFGELILAPAVIRREARAVGRPFSEAMIRLIVHGALHLAGIHHGHSSVQKQKSIRLEGEITARLGIGEVRRLRSHRHTPGRE